MGHTNDSLSMSIDSIDTVTNSTEELSNRISYRSGGGGSIDDIDRENAIDAIPLNQSRVLSAQNDAFEVDNVRQPKYGRGKFCCTLEIKFIWYATQFFVIRVTKTTTKTIIFICFSVERTQTIAERMN